MDFFFSGVSSPREVDYLLQAEVEKILINPVDFQAVGHLIPSKKTLILDSMAYKFFKRGQTPTYRDWRSLIASIDTSRFLYIVAPDVIGDPDLTLENWRAARRDYPELPLLPTFQWGALRAHLDEYLGSAPVVGIGGLIPLMRAKDPEMLTQLTSLCAEHPGRFHVFGIPWLKAFNAIKHTVHSGDSSVWLAGARYGQLIFTHARNGHLLRTKAERVHSGDRSSDSLCIQNARNIEAHLKLLPPPMPIQSPSERTYESVANAPNLETDPSYGSLICNVASNGSGTVAKMDTDPSYGSLICKAAGQIADWLVQGEAINSHRIAIAMRSHFGSGAEGRWTIKDSHEAQEVALIKAIQRQLVGSAAHLAQHLTDNPQSIRAWLQGLQKALPTHTGRTDESNDLQQFSTPLELGYLAYLAGNPQPWDILLEPSAGTGMLAVLASLVVDSMILNEISDRRADILRQVYGQTVTTFNAEQIHNYLPADRLPTLTFLNPPFSSSPKISRRSANATLKHLRSAIKRTSTNGRIVLISAHWFHPDQPEWQEAFAKIQKEATLLLSAPVLGAVYQRHGTHVQTRLSVFEKRPAPQANIFSGVVHEEDLEALFLRVMALPPRQAADITLLEGQQLEGQQLEGQQLHGAEAEAVAIATEPIEAEQDGQPLRDPEAEVGAIAAELVEAVQLEVQLEAVEADQLEAAQKPSSPSLLVEAKTTFEDVIEIQYRPRQVGATHSGELSEGVYETYSPQRIEIVGSQAHPSKLCESAAMSSVIPPMPSYRPMLPRPVVENGILSEAQLEAIVYAGEAHSRYLKGTYQVADDLSQISPTAASSPVATKFRRGWFLGDGTGCGKGRQIAGMMADGWVRGRKKALWISEKATLIEDARRDWAAIGGDRLDITSLSKFKLRVPIPIGSGILFCTYATLRSQAQQDKASRLQQVIDWLGPDFDGLVCFDESHALAGALKTKTERGQAAGSLQGKAGICLQNGVPNARIVYVSATGATKVESLAYASRLGLWQTGDFPFANREEFINQISNSGVAAMEVVARDLKSLGLYMARTLSYDGVEYSPLPVSLTPEQRQVYDKFAHIFQIIHQNIDAALRETGAKSESGRTQNSQAVANAHSAFEGTKLRFFNHLIIGLKTPTLIQAIEQDLLDGHSCLVQLISTNEAIVDRKLAEIPVEEWHDLSIDVSPRDTIADYLRRCFPVLAHEEYQDGDEIKSKPILDKDGKPVYDQAAIALRETLIEELAFLPPVPGALEQILFHFGEENVAEVTGRSRRLLFDQAESRIYAASRNAATSNLLETQAFQDGKKRILVFSDAGGTGRSYHADLSAKNQQRRCCYILEPGYRADKATQACGRAHRTFQRSAPIFRIVACQDIPGEKRFVSTIAKRLFSLGALTRGQRQAAGENLFSARDDLENEYAQAALYSFLFLMTWDKFEECSSRDFEAMTGLTLRNEDGSVNSEGIPMTRFMNRLLALPLQMQEILFGKLDQLIEYNIEAALETGQYETGVQTLRAKRFDIVGDQAVYTHPETGATTLCLDIEQVDDAYYKKARTVYQHEVSGRGGQLLVNDRSKRAAIAQALPSMMSPDGVPERRVQLIRPKATTRMKLADLKTSTWRNARSKREWETLWNEEVENASGEVKRRFFLLTGLLLPIWTILNSDRKEQFRVVRLKDANGNVHLGRQVSPEGMTRLSLTLGMNQVELSGQDVYRSVMEDGKGIELAKGIRLKKSKVCDESRLELVGYLSAALSEQIVRLGAFKEIFNSAVRHFIPTNPQAPAIIEAVQGLLQGPKLKLQSG